MTRFSERLINNSPGLSLVTKDHVVPLGLPRFARLSEDGAKLEYCKVPDVVVPSGAGYTFVVDCVLFDMRGSKTLCRMNPVPRSYHSSSPGSQKLGKSRLVMLRSGFVQTVMDGHRECAVYE